MHSRVNVHICVEMLLNPAQLFLVAIFNVHLYLEGANLLYGIYSCHVHVHSEIMLLLESLQRKFLPFLLSTISLDTVTSLVLILLEQTDKHHHNCDYCVHVSPQQLSRAPHLFLLASHGLIPSHVHVTCDCCRECKVGESEWSSQVGCSQ